MNILYIVQQSVYNNNNKWISADSNLIMVAGIVDQLLEKTDWNIDIMIAPIDKFSDIIDYNQLLIRSSNKIKFIVRDSPISAFTNRYHFDANFFYNILKEGNYDIIINNIIELTRNIKTVCYELKQYPKIIVSNYWIDCPLINEEKVPLDISYDWRQIDGAECADLVTFTCPSTKCAFLNNCDLRINSKVALDISKKSTIWDFGFSAYELNKYRNIVFPETKSTIKMILFPNRLSMINYTHHEEFIEAVNNLYEKRQDFRVVFTNPSQKISWGWLKDNVKSLYCFTEKSLSRGQYISLLWNSDIIVSLYTIERYGGCANVEGIYCEAYPVMTNFGEYPFRAQGTVPLVKIDLSNLEEVLNIALNDCKKQSLNNIKLRKDLVFNSSSYEKVSDKVINDVRRITNT